MLSKSQIIEAIQAINKSARREWLGVFDVAELRAYLDHLQLTLEPRGARSAWIRRAGSPPVITRLPVG